MSYLDALKNNETLVESLGLQNAHFVWAISMYLEEPDTEALASEALTDGPDDKKIDFIYLDRGGKRIIIAQGYYSEKNSDAAPANKASDLNTAAAWFISGEIKEIPHQLKAVIEDCRSSISEGEIDSIGILYVHNLPESINVNRELQTVVTHFKTSIGEDSHINIFAKEIGISQIQNIFATQESHIEVVDEIVCPAKPYHTENGPTWKADVMSVPASWLHSIFVKYGESLFSANYRGFLGITHRRKINTAIRTSAENKPTDFWVFNNGITILTRNITIQKESSILSGISIINGAQTTGSIGSVDTTKFDLREVQVLCRIITCSDSEKIREIVKNNNTQNEITTWDQYSNDPEQFRIEKEFNEFGRSYSRKRGFNPSGGQIGIEEVAQPLLAFQGRFRDANRGKNDLFDRMHLYKQAFERKKARHILFVYTLARTIDERRLNLKSKSNSRTIIGLEEKQLALLRNLRFKYFFISVVGKVLEPVIGERVDISNVGFTTEGSNQNNFSIVALTAIWAPIVETILTFVSSQITEDTVSDKLKQDNILEEISSQVESLVYTSMISNPAQFSEFKRLVASI